MTTLQTLIKEIKSLTPIPAVAGRLAGAIDDPGCSVNDIADIIKFDPSATANLLKACNSAYFGLANPVESVKEAVAMAGMDTVVELVLFQAGARALSTKQKGYGLHEGVMWKHAVASALIAKLISEKSGVGNKNTIFTAALLKDIGKTVLDRYVSDSFESIIDLVHNRGCSFREAEKKVIGIDHAELGAIIAKNWNFSPRMVQMIRHHHLADEAQHGDLEIAAVYLADCICMMMGIGLGEDGLAYRFHAGAVKALGMTHDDISMIIADFGNDMQKVEELISLS